MHEVIELTGPTVVHSYHVLDAKQRTVFRGASGLSLRELAPKTTQATVCMYNGDYVLPEDQDWIPSSEDHILYIVLPRGGGNASQSIIGIVLIVIGIYTGQTNLIFAGAALLVVGLLPMPSFTPLQQQTQDAASPTYNINLGGNSARLGQSIPVLYGRHLVVPDFASQSYSEFDDEGDQYYHALLCFGQLDRFTLESLMIDDTELSHFEDVQKRWIGPHYASTPSLVNPAVVNAPEIASQDLIRSHYVGPFACCGPTLRTIKIGIDIIAPKGLYYADDDGELDSKSATWLVEARKINDKGASSGSWFLLGLETLTDNTSRAVRRSYSYTVSPGRYEVRISRQDVRDTNSRAGHDLQWMGMRAYLNSPAPLEPTATFLELRIRATSQLSGLSQRKISGVIIRWLPTWTPEDGWAPASETRDIAPALADVLRNTTYGAKAPDTRIDLETLYELDLIWKERGDQFNGVFDKRVTVWNALTTIARAGRARPIMRGNMVTFVRDQAQDLPVAMFNMRNIMRGTFNIDYNLLSDDITDGLEMGYFSELSWAPAYVTTRINPANTITLVTGSEDSPIDPAKISFMGITNEDQAICEALQITADAMYRRSSISFTTELEGYLPAYGDLIAVSHDVTSWGYSGEVSAWDVTTHIAIVTEDLTWTVGNHYAILQGVYGDVYGPYKVESGPMPRSLLFIDIPDPDIEIYTGTGRERTKFSFGPANNFSKYCVVKTATPKDDNQVDILAIVDDSRVHTADDGYVRGSTGGSGGSGRVARYAPDGLPTYDAASDDDRDHYGFYGTDDGTVGSGEDEGYVYDT